MKVAKEDLIGILAAVEWYLAQDHAAVARRYEAVVEHVLDWARDRSDVSAVRETSGQAGQPTPPRTSRSPRGLRRGGTRSSRACVRSHREWSCSPTAMPGSTSRRKRS